MTEQPPKQASYYQSNNPITYNPLEQQLNKRQRGDPVPATTISHRTANSKPSNDDSLAQRQESHDHDRSRKQNAPDVDLEYGVEQSSAEGEIAEAVENKGTRARAQAGAHAGPVGSAYGPGFSGFGKERNQTADLTRKREEHNRVLGDQIGQSPAAPGDEVRERKLKLDDQLDVKGAVEEATGDPVVGR